MQDQINLFSNYVSKIGSLGLEYFVTGSVAGIVFGEPRLTHDIDLVVKLPKSMIVSFLDSFPESEYYRPPEETIIQEIGRTSRGHINLIHFESGFKADIYFPGREAIQKWGLESRKKILVQGLEVYFPPLEYVILFKLKYLKEGGSDKHRRDIIGILRVSSEIINLLTLHEMAKELGLDIELAELIAESKE